MSNSVVDSKLCKDCNLVLPACNFSRDKSKKSGLCTYCKPCKKKRMDTYYSENWKIISKRATDWGRKNRDRVSEMGAARRYARRDELLPKRRQKHKDRMASDINYRLNHCVRAHLRRVVKRGGVSGTLGYGTDDLKKRMEVQFSKGMSWDNYGDWEIDHKIPISTFIARGIVDSRVINTLSNLQPMWKSENRSKGARYVG